MSDPDDGESDAPANVEDAGSGAGGVDTADEGRTAGNPFDEALASDADDTGGRADPDTLFDDDDADSTATAFTEPLGVGERSGEDDLEDAFESVDIEEIDTESVWDELLGAEADAEAFDADPAGESTASASVSAGPSTSVDADVAADAETEGFDTDPGSVGGEDLPPQDIGADDDVAIVDKRVYCQQCPHFSQPPAVRCTREGTSIAEVLEDGRFRLHNCPVVTEEGPDRSYFTGHDS